MTEKNKIQVKISYLMIALTVARCIYTVTEEVSEDLSLTNLNLKRKALLRDAVIKAKTEQTYLCWLDFENSRVMFQQQASIRNNVEFSIGQHIY